MKRVLLCFAAMPLLLMTFTFAQSTVDATETDMAGDDSMRDGKHKGMGCSEIRDEARDAVHEVRDDIKQNWQDFRADYGKLSQYFLDSTDEDKEAIKALRAEGRDFVKDEKKAARDAFKESWDLGLIDEVHGVVIALRAETLEALRDYVTIDAHGYDEWVDGFLATLETNKALRSDNASTRYDYRQQCYDKRSQTMYDRVMNLLERIINAWDDEKILERLPNLLEKVDDMIEKTAASTKPDDWKEERIEMLYVIQDAIEEVLDGIE